MSRESVSHPRKGSARKLRKWVSRTFGWPNAVDEPGSFDAPQFTLPRTSVSRLLWSALPQVPASNTWTRLLQPMARKKVESLRLINASGLLDARWYERRHPAVAAGHWTAAEHYLDVGARNGFIPSPDFDGNLYTMLNPQIVRQRSNPLAHFASTGTPLPEPLDPRAGLPLRCCILLHVFYVDLWDELAAYLSSVNGTRFSLFVNIPEPVATPELRRRIERRLPEATIVVSPNRGRDVGGFFRLLSLVDFDDYDVFLLAHSKRSPHCKAEMADSWRRRLLNALLGSPEIFRENLALFASYPTIGGLGAASARRSDLGRNGATYGMLLDRMGVPATLRACEYVTGTMLMARSSVMRRLYQPIADLQFESGDDMPLDFHVDGQLAHAVERCIGAVIRAENLELAWRPSSPDFDLPAPTQPIVSSGSPVRARPAAA